MALVLRSTRRRSFTVSDLEYSVAQLRRDSSPGVDDSELYPSRSQGAKRASDVPRCGHQTV